MFRVIVATKIILLIKYCRGHVPGIEGTLSVNESTTMGNEGGGSCDFIKDRSDSRDGWEMGKVANRGRWGSRDEEEQMNNLAILERTSIGVI